MEISSCSCHLKTGGVLHILPRTNFSQKHHHKLNMIQCSANMFRNKSSNLYQVLSLESENVGFDDIKKAYRTMARQYHPDVVPASRKEESTRMFVELQRAYETLSNPIERKNYDNELMGHNVTNAAGASTSFRKEVWEGQLEGLRLRKRSKRR